MGIVLLVGDIDGVPWLPWSGGCRADNAGWPVITAVGNADADSRINAIGNIVPDKSFKATIPPEIFR
jgi:hypothetical protein